MAAAGLQQGQGVGRAFDRCGGVVLHELAAGTLVPFLADYSLRAGQPAYAVYPARPWLALKTATFVAFLQERLFAT